jgi:6-carboxyhexanoate--CoA ligase
VREEKEETGLPEEDFFSIRMRAFSGEKHLSGGEDLVERSALRDRLLALTEQGLTSSRNQEGVLPSLNIRVEPVKNSSVLRKTLLPVHCLESSSHQETLSFLSGVLEAIGSRESIDTSSLGRWLNDVLNGTESGLSGASLFFPDGERWIPENRGVRVTQFGMVPAIRQTLLEEAKNHPAGSGRRFVDALQIASKVAGLPDFLLELCASDNPEYTTGYIALRNFGYLRLPLLKRAGNSSGGRVILLSRKLDERERAHAVSYLSRTPVLFTGRSRLFPASTGECLLGKIVQKGDEVDGKPGIS